ncbi:MAG: 16S rRNA (cytosine(1402)-N(4))-methyltransferase RsmH [bacterium]|nr:16S rRNA (cytosine(1402)-N(4))-methyltransferase RsmH [bacterium]
MTIHHAVLVEETMHLLDVKPNGRYVDGTLGGGTHSEELLKRCAPDGRVLSLDVDRNALTEARARFASYGDRWQGIEENFRHMKSAVESEPFGPVDGVLLDLGFSSDQIGDPQKGLSFLENGPLDMRLGPKSNVDGLTAADIVNSWSQDEIEKMIANFGEEKFARRIAEAIVKARHASRIIGTLDLVTIIRHAVPPLYERGRIHPATRTFQALRIAVNDELEVLKEAIEEAYAILKENGRLVIITFHSLEDRIVKQAFKSTAAWQVITKRPVGPTDEEITANPRARSAKVRAANKIIM